ncbi:MAG: Dabb family protein [Caldilineales bacterium]|nr:Dabb family protein [Caldilineales bacterium]
MHIHNVYFWLRDDLNNDEQIAFEHGLASLTTDENVISGYYGIPADTHRDVVENSYSYGLVLIFANLAGHDLYQVGDVHLAFVEAHLPKWTKAVVHDIETI